MKRKRKNECFKLIGHWQYTENLSACSEYSHSLFCFLVSSHCFVCLTPCLLELKVKCRPKPRTTPARIFLQFWNWRGCIRRSLHLIVSNRTPHKSRHFPLIHEKTARFSYSFEAAKWIHRWNFEGMVKPTTPVLYICMYNTYMHFDQNLTIQTNSRLEHQKLKFPKSNFYCDTLLKISDKYMNHIFADG